MRDRFVGQGDNSNTLVWPGLRVGRAAASARRSLVGLDRAAG